MNPSHRFLALSAVCFGMAACGDDERSVVHELSTAEVAEGNVRCSQLGLGQFEYKVEYEWGPGSYVFDGFNTVVLSFHETALGEVLNITSTLGLDAVLVKGGPDTAVYRFNPEQTSATGLHPPVNPRNDRYFGISHVSWCFDYELDVSKTARTSYTRTWDWSIEKSVSPDAHQVAPDASGASTYEVIVTNHGYADSDHRISGEVTVANNTPYPATLVSITDTLSNSASVPLTCDGPEVGLLASGAVLTCSYSVALDGPTDLTNHVVVATTGLIAGGEASAEGNFADAEVTRVNESVEVIDDYEGEVTSLGTVTDTTTFTYDREFSCADEGLNFNTATIVETGDAASASVRVVCARQDAQGCTPGYWKNHPRAWIPTGYTTATRIRNVFGNASPYIGSNDTLLAGLSYRGGPTVRDAAQILLRAAIAALLDAAHPGVAYPISVAEVIARTNAALASGSRATMLDAKDILDQYNNLGCPL